MGLPTRASRNGTLLHQKRFKNSREGESSSRKCHNQKNIIDLSLVQAFSAEESTEEEEFESSSFLANVPLSKVKTARSFSVGEVSKSRLASKSRQSALDSSPCEEDKKWQAPKNSKSRADDSCNMKEKQSTEIATQSRHRQFARSHRNSVARATNGLSDEVEYVQTRNEKQLRPKSSRRTSVARSIRTDDSSSDGEKDSPPTLQGWPTSASRSRRKRARRDAFKHHSSSRDECKMVGTINKDDIMEIPHSDTDESEMDVPYAHGFDETQARLASELSDTRREPLRPGDVIFYCHPAFVAGSKQGLRVTQILQTDPAAEFPLDLDNGDFLLSECKVKRIQEYRRGRLYQHAGIFKPIENFLYTHASLHPDEKGNLLGLQRQIERCRKKMCEARTVIEAGPVGGYGDSSDGDLAPKSARNNGRNSSRRKGCSGLSERNDRSPSSSTRSIHRTRTTVKSSPTSSSSKTNKNDPVSDSSLVLRQAREILKSIPQHENDCLGQLADESDQDFCDGSVRKSLLTASIGNVGRQPPRLSLNKHNGKKGKTTVARETSFQSAANLPPRPDVRDSTGKNHLTEKLSSDHPAPDRANSVPGKRLTTTGASPNRHKPLFSGSDYVDFSQTPDDEIPPSELHIEKTTFSSRHLDRSRSRRNDQDDDFLDDDSTLPPSMLRVRKLQVAPTFGLESVTRPQRRIKSFLDKSPDSCAGSDGGGDNDNPEAQRQSQIEEFRNVLRKHKESKEQLLLKVTKLPRPPSPALSTASSTTTRSSVYRPRILEDLSSCDYGSHDGSSDDDDGLSIRKHRNEKKNQPAKLQRVVERDDRGYSSISSTFSSSQSVTENRQALTKKKASILAKARRPFQQATAAASRKRPMQLDLQAIPPPAR